jgi:broad specificity phosphatase PhoE
MQNSLTEEGRRQIEDIAETLVSQGVSSPWVYYSISASAAEAAEILLQKMFLDRTRLVPEYSYLDAR